MGFGARAGAEEVFVVWPLRSTLWLGLGVGARHQQGFWLCD